MKFENIPIISWDIYDDNNNNSQKNLSHSILIPNHIYDAFLCNNTEDNPILFIKMKDITQTNLDETNNFLVFGNIEVTDMNVCVLPYWAMSKLNFSQFQHISIENINCIKEIGYIKFKANNSNYVYWEDIKKILENELENYRCLCTGDLVYIGDVEFYVTELRDINAIQISYGSLFNSEPSIEFEMPTDIEHKELIYKQSTQNKIMPRTITELEYNDNSNSPVVSYTLTFHTGEEIKMLEKHYLENKLNNNKKKI
jgi:hypothetical protein